jgi:hypothetical protein
VSGNYQRLSSGFVKLTVTQSSGHGVKTGTVRYGLEVPGVAFLSQAMLTTELGIITTVAGGHCPTANYTSNWLLTQYLPSFDMSDPNKNAFGTFSWDQQTGTGTLPTQYAIAGNYQANGPDSAAITGSCGDGIMATTIHGVPATVYLTSQGAAIVKFHEADGVLALPADPIPSKEALAGKYAGIIVNLNDIFVPVRPVQATIDEQADVSLNGLYDVDPLVIDGNYGGTATFDALNAPSNGLAEVTVTTGNGTGKMECMASTNLLSTGKNLIFCVGQAPGSVAMNAHAYSVLLVSK